MKAIEVSALNEAAQLIEKPVPRPQTGEVLVKIVAAALNHRDVWVQKGMYPGIKYPVQPGSDGAGIVVSIGTGVNEHWLNQEVIINPSHNWGENPAFYGKDFKILGSPDAGTFAEYIAVPARYLYAKPSHLTFEQAAALPLAGLTAWRSLTTRGRLKVNEKVLITGIGGGVALFALQFALATQAEVWVTSGADEKIIKAKALGAIGGINYTTPQWNKELMNQAGLFDLIIDSACGDGFSKLIDLAKPGGRIVFYGGTTGNINNLLPAKIFFKQLDIMGSTMGNESEFQAMTQLVEQHQIVPVIDLVLHLQEAQEAFIRMEKAQQFGKIVLKVG